MPWIYYDDVFLTHDTGHHPECADRLRVIHEHLLKVGLWDANLRPTKRDATVEEIALVHTPEHIERVRALSAEGGAFDADTALSKGSYAAAVRAVGAVLEACDSVLGGKTRSAFCAVRPPGHHAMPNRAMGFCLFNNVAIAARYLEKKHGLKRIAIVDWDVHHGNGTQAALNTDPCTFFLSLQRFPFWPGSGASDEKGEGPGKGLKLNIPLPYNTSREHYLSSFQYALEGPVADFKPQFILISAGFDTYKDDPIGGLNLDVEDFGRLTQIVAKVAQTHCGGKTVSSLEGGYNLQGLPLCVEQHFRALP